jgi:hypothetical protein
MLAVFACALALAFTASAQAAHGAHGGRPAMVHGHYPGYAVRFEGGYYYRAHHHPVWSYRVYDSGLRCYKYYDPYGCCFYYYQPVRQCWYPVGYVCP